MYEDEDASVQVHISTMIFNVIENLITSFSHDIILYWYITEGHLNPGPDVFSWFF